MGEVYRATDSRLGREVALKVLPPDVANDPVHLARFEREARALATLDHPGIVTVFSVEEANDIRFLTMQLIQGQTLAQLIPRDGLPAQRVMELAAPLAGAVAAAHRKEIVHRDLKPANVMVTNDGQVKVLDFGLAKQVERPVSADEATEAHGPSTHGGAIVGTMPYMSPEQIEGRNVGPPSDIFALGIVLYEMATGRRPFQGNSAPALISSILKDSPPAPSTLRPGISPELDSLIDKCLEKDAQRRPSASDLHDSLVRLRTPAAAARRPLRPGIAVAAGLTVLAIAAIAWMAVTRSRRQTFVAEAVPRIERLARETKYVEAFALAAEVERSGGASVIDDELRELFSSAVSIESSPKGASISVRPFGGTGEWTRLGTAPLATVRVPDGPLHWRAELRGHSPAIRITAYPGETMKFELRPDSAAERDMVLVPAADVNIWSIGTVAAPRRVPIGSFLIDRREVTNAQFARFISDGGYTRPELWKHELRDGARTLTFAEAMSRFRDATGRPGPAGWRLGAFPDGEDDVPVSGVSWFEAAAFAELAGKELPTLYHWYQADTGGDLQLLPGLILPTANFESKAPRADRGHHGSAYGAIDMAGNVREWSATQSSDGMRLILGGAWNDPSYLFLIPTQVSSFDRSSGNGFRCIRRLGKEPLAEEATRALPPKPAIDNIHRQPVSAETYEVFTRFFDHEQVPLDARIEVTEEARHWVKQKVTYAAGHGGERMQCWLYLPKNARPPYQLMIMMAGASTFFRSKSSATESDIFGWSYAESLIRGGRAVLVPIWKGSYERQDGFHPFETERTSYRQHVIAWVTELRQSMDYLETRKDIDATKIGYQGTSFGTLWGPLFLALEPRLRTGIFLLGGLPATVSSADRFPPELEGFHYAPRVTQPVLMLAGRYDPIFPYETSQLPLFRLLGTPPGEKRHRTFPAGHSSHGWRDQMDREVADWLDARFGVVARR